MHFRCFSTFESPPKLPSRHYCMIYSGNTTQFKANRLVRLDRSAIPGPAKLIATFSLLTPRYGRGSCQLGSAWPENFYSGSDRSNQVILSGGYRYFDDSSGSKVARFDPTQVLDIILDSLAVPILRCRGLRREPDLIMIGNYSPLFLYAGDIMYSTAWRSRSGVPRKHFVH